MYSYRAYSLGIHSDFPLPELAPSAAAPRDVAVRLGRIDSPIDSAGPEPRLETKSEESLLFWRCLGKFLVRGGNEIIIDPLPDVDQQLIRLPLLGTVFAVLLHHRGLLVLHGSAVSMDGGAIVFLGNKGWGKSTTAAALYARGHHLITDDLIVFESDNELEEGQRCSVLPGFPMIKLWPDAAASSLGDDPGSLPRLAFGYEKRARAVTDRFARRPVPLTCIYVLSEGPVLEIKSLGPQEAIKQLIAHSYVTRFGDQLLSGGASRWHLRQCAEVASRLPVFRLERPNSLSAVGTLAELIETHVRGRAEAGRVVSQGVYGGGR